MQDKKKAEDRGFGGQRSPAHKRTGLSPEALSVIIPRTQIDFNSLSVRDVRRVTRLDDLRGFVDVEVGPFLLTVQVWQKPGHHPWIALPGRHDRRGAWWPDLRCHDRRLQQAIERLALKAWREVGA